MKYETTKEEMEQGLNKLWLEEDDMELQVNFVEKREDVYVLNSRAIIDGEAYNNFEIEVMLVEDKEISSVTEILSLEWDWYDLII